MKRIMTGIILISVVMSMSSYAYYYHCERGYPPYHRYDHRCDNHGYPHYGERH